VARIPRAAERDEFNQLTAIKLALQLVEHRTQLSEYQRRLLGTALQATDRLHTGLLERVAAARQRALLEQAEHRRDRGDHRNRTDAGRAAGAARDRLFPAGTEPT
jgi:hypothetical protein